MRAFFDTLAARASENPHAPALRDGHRTVTRAGLAEAVDRAAETLAALEPTAIALFADNGPDWIVADLAAARCGIPVVPVPPYFTAAQVAHLLAAAPVDFVLGDAKAADGLPGASLPDGVAGGLVVKRLAPSPSAAALPPGCVKVTFTSGSTGAPRGVCLSGDLLDTVTRRLCGLFGELAVARHLCSTPLATLLENVAGVYVPLALGASVTVPSLAALGLYGSSRIDARRFLDIIEESGAESLILLPQVLRELVVAVRNADVRLPLRYVAVGGAHVAAADLAAARDVGIPAFQGYGLSECGSVVAINRPGDGSDTSVGKPLPGIDVTIAEDGEIRIRNQCMSGYLGDTAAPEEIATGDLGRFDEAGNLFVTGRKKNLFITSYGRNVSPEWPEAELLCETGVLQACVVGEAMPVNTAVLVIDSERLSAGELPQIIAATNLRLPDYARIGQWIVAEEAFSASNGLLTSNGKLCRDAIAARYFPDPARPATVAM